MMQNKFKTMSFHIFHERESLEKFYVHLSLFNNNFLSSSSITIFNHHHHQLQPHYHHHTLNQNPIGNAETNESSNQISIHS